MQVQIAEATPPYVVFEAAVEEDREASLAAGYYIPRDVDFAVITPAGSKDRIPKRVDEWFAMLSEQSREGRFPSNWLSAYREAYRAWKEGRELPISGTPIRNWPIPTPSQRKLCEDAHVQTVEQLASANEETIALLGMGGRALCQRAKDYLEAKGDAGKLSAEMEILRRNNEDLKATNVELSEKLKKLSSQMEDLLASRKK